MDSLKGVKSALGGSGAGLGSGAGAGSYLASMETLLGDYMERLGTRINVLETELRYAWRALDMLSQEYVKMWERLEKLEILLYEQQAVIAQLLEFYTAFDLQALLIEKEEPSIIPPEAVAAAAAAAAAAAPSSDDSENRLPDEAFYRSLNNAHRDNLSQVSESTDQELARIWDLEETEKESDSSDARKKEKEREKENENEKEKKEKRIEKSK